uniref:Uncharacterized protein n=1 Tax=viral metagenome TaxID=1070528 RepID=A0A6M3JQ51_9ZZZZ
MTCKVCKGRKKIVDIVYFPECRKEIIDCPFCTNGRRCAMTRFIIEIEENLTDEESSDILGQLEDVVNKNFTLYDSEVEEL